MDNRGQPARENFRQRVWRRISDKSKAPRCWWLPTEAITFADDEQWQRQHDEVSNTIRRVMLAIVAFSLFCILALGAPDVNLIAKNASIKLPFADTEVSYSGFLIVGPLILVGLFAYLHIFVGYLGKLAPPSTRVPLPFIFNMPSSFTRWISDILLYYMVPVVLLAFTWKAAPRSEGVWLLFFSMLLGACTLYLKIRRFQWGTSPTRLQRARFGTLWLILVMLLGLTAYAPAIPLHRPLSLFKVDLRGLDLRGTNLKEAFLEEAKLANANLERAELRDANLLRAKLQGANLSGANLQGAFLQNANLEGANLQNTFLLDANLAGANLQAANLASAELRDAILLSANLEKAELENANLRNADLREAKLQHSNLRNANLVGVNLERANLEGAILAFVKLKDTKLVNANLAQANLEGAYLINTNLVGANLEHANLESAILEDPMLENANLKYANLARTNLTCEQLTKAKFWEFAYRSKNLACGKPIPEPAK